MEFCRDAYIFWRTRGPLVFKFQVSAWYCIFGLMGWQPDGVWLGGGEVAADTRSPPAALLKYLTFLIRTLISVLDAACNYFKTSLLLFFFFTKSAPSLYLSRGKSRGKLNTIFVQVGDWRTAPSVKFRSDSRLSLIPNPGSIPGDPN